MYGRLQRHAFGGRSAMCLEGPTPTPTPRRWEQMCDEVWCVTAPHALTLERLRARNGLEEEEAERRIASQVSTQPLRPLILHPLLPQPLLLHPLNPTIDGHRRARSAMRRRALLGVGRGGGARAGGPRVRGRHGEGKARAARTAAGGGHAHRARVTHDALERGVHGCARGAGAAAQVVAQAARPALRPGAPPTTPPSHLGEIPMRSPHEISTRSPREAFPRSLPAVSATPYHAQVRHYHTLTHLGEIFARLDGRCASLEQPRRLVFATFFHDSIYEPTAKDNELRSAQARRTAHDTWYMAWCTRMVCTW